MDVSFLNECFTYNPDTGILHWKVRPLSHFKSERGANFFNLRYAGKRAGHAHYFKSSGSTYMRVLICGANHLQHRIAYQIFHGVMLKEDEEIDHINGNTTDNSIHNLRAVSKSVNLKNKSIYKNNTTGVCGVSFHKRSGKFCARITIEGRRKVIGYFKTVEQAKEARDKAYHDSDFHPNHGRRRI